VQLQKTIEELFSLDVAQLRRGDVLPVFNELKFFLNKGEIRSAEYIDENWSVNLWVKKGILLGFRTGILSEVKSDTAFHFFDKDILTIKNISLEDSIRIVPGGTVIRDGSFVGKNVIVMPPAYINIGAFVDEGTLVDSHALVGSCAQIGKRVHLSAGAQIGGVLEPIGALPVIIEDDVLVGGNTGIFEGIIVKKGAVIAAGVQLTSSMPVYDIVHNTIVRKTEKTPLIIPENAVVVMGTRTINDNWANEHHLSIYTPLIIKYRDDKTMRSASLEQSLR
jgi:2,3,4,5-tetrahydropyridine-2-carboxylate N-succinyltransferase